MIISVLMVHDETKFVESLAEELKSEECEVVHFVDPLVAIGALDVLHNLRILVTSVEFPARRIHGITLAFMVRNKRAGVQVIFTGEPESIEAITGLGEFLPTSVGVPEMVETIKRRLNRPG